MNKWLKYSLVILLILGLILVRKFEETLFYDPFLQFFKGDYLHAEFPDYQTEKIALNIGFRYALNSIISLGIIGLIFEDKSKIKFTALVLVGFFIILLPLYLYMISIQFSIGENIGFYIRRFLIQPMLVLILIPAFYYQYYLTKQKT
ncbi:MAG: exosortase F system-associated protein [Weeksellaceae bacterium]|jgi:exosortase F-associated protein|nr:exosortase F system-associated protein [Weeksellaceae bacterium]MDX9704173.1 exosortase F system-associated protein [Weeksellaceae bacterium]